MANKTSYVLIAFIISISVFSGFSVIGILQSTERISSSGIIVQPNPSPPLPPPPEPGIDIDVFCDYQCTEIMTNIEWGDIVVGESVKHTMWVKNSGDSDVFINLDEDNWNPISASEYLSITWDYDGVPISPGSVRQISLSLNVSPNIQGIDTFYFDVVFIASVQ